MSSRARQVQEPAVSMAQPWAVLSRAIVEERRVRLCYHGHQRVVCPHVLGWKNDRPTVLVYQLDGTTSTGALPQQPQKRWRSMLLDDIEDPVITDGCWQGADNYSRHSVNIDRIAVCH